MLYVFQPMRRQQHSPAPAHHLLFEKRADISGSARINSQEWLMDQGIVEV
jgi:hypothetical protein